MVLINIGLTSSTVPISTIFLNFSESLLISSGSSKRRQHLGAKQEAPVSLNVHQKHQMKQPTSWQLSLLNDIIKNVIISLNKMTSHKLFFQKNFFYFLWFSTSCVIFSSRLSHFLVLSAISIFNDLTLVLISQPHPSNSHTPWQSFVCIQRKIEAIGTVLATVVMAGPPSLIEFHSLDNDLIRRSQFKKITRLFCKRDFFN